jgi:hypothetical protein
MSFILPIIFIVFVSMSCIFFFYWEKSFGPFKIDPITIAFFIYWGILLYFIFYTLMIPFG